MSTSLIEEVNIRKREIASRLAKVEDQLKALSAGQKTPDGAGGPQVQINPEEKKRLESIKQGILQEQDIIDRESELIENRLARLRFWLTIQSVGGIALGLPLLIWFHSKPEFFGNWYLLPILAAVAFLPLLISTLNILEQRRWIWILVVVVGVPALLNLIPTDDQLVSTVFLAIPLVLFYAYCGLLRRQVGDWLE